ncbi:glycosyltransferase family 41 protein [Magnetospirillum sp. SS-4]|uniref:O-linked N-acetylglucosamine transferase, SPINDLY family protein n=1 Tax=Magnetospirillum sp. SS-4 TaxID=2681465 RepID=UPI0013815508|nr:glycosyltransferase family 41 protein [Magnetospirillum sp. SS-4]CAA7620158.1 hypothetical protein MTBSS4_270056 [Magnetospirillum sp. SS-4]
MSRLEQWLIEAATALVPGGIEPPPAGSGDAAAWIRRGIALLMAGRNQEALAALDHAMALTESEPVGWLALTVARLRGGDWRGAASAAWFAVRLIPDDPDLAAAASEVFGGVRMVGQSLAAAGRYAEADDMFDHLLLLNPRDWGALHDQGVAAYRRGAFDVAADLLRRVVAESETPVALCNLGAALSDQGLAAEALTVYRRCIAAFPGHAPAYYNAGCSLAVSGRLAEAEAMHRKAIAIRPDYADAFNNLGNLQADLGRMPEAVESFRTAVRFKPDNVLAHSNLLYNMYYLPEVTGPQLATEARRWGETSGALGRPGVIHDNDRDPGRRLRIGYLSPDFRDHAASYFMEPVLEHHDRDAFEVTCYSLNKINDHVTERMRANGHGWRDVARLSDQALADLIRGDGIDILVDCAGHTHGNRLAMFALEPAPIQVGNHLGMAGTLGVPAIRHFVTDRHIAPEGTDDHFTETVVRLPNAFMPFRPREDWPEVSPRQPGPPLFAFFADPLRLSPMLVGMLRRILDGVPGARLLLKNSRYGNPQTVRHYRQMLAPLGDRFDFETIEGGWARQWPVYGRISVMLDGFPVTGATSTVIPLWMGVPVISLGGTHPGQRFGVSMLTNAGVPELIAATPDQYVDMAVDLACDGDRLERYRATLRATLAASPLLDCRGGTRDLEQAFRGLWRRWCRGEGG